MRTRAAVIVLTICVMSAGLAARAGAATRLVATTGSDAANTCLTTPCKTIAHAVSVASANDTISIGAGTYAEEVIATVPLTFAGAGGGTAAAPAPGGTFIDATASVSPALTMQAGGGVTGLRLRGGLNGGSPFDESSPALKVAPSVTATLTVSDSTLVQTPVSGPSSSDESDGALVLSAGPAQPLTATVQRATIVGEQDGIDADGPGVHAAIDHSSIVGGTLANAVADYAAASLTITDSSVPSSGSQVYGVLVQNGPATIARSTLTGRDAGLFVDTAASAPAVANVSDSVLEALPLAGNTPPIAGAIVRGDPTPDSGTLNLTGVTAVAYGPHATAGVLAYSGDTAGAIANLKRTIAFAADTLNPPTPPPALKADGAGGTATITAANSEFPSSAAVAPGTVPAVGSPTNAGGDPMFANLAMGDLHLLPGSPALNLGDPATLAPGETDLGGGPRSAPATCGGAALPDAGAYELVATCPIPIAAPPPPPPPVKLTLTKVSLSHTSFRPRVKHGRHATGGSTLHFTLSIAASLSGKVQLIHRRKHHKTTYTTAGHALRLTGPKGADSAPFTASGLKPGAYRLTLTATAGKTTTKPVVIAFTILPAVQKHPRSRHH